MNNKLLIKDQRLNWNASGPRFTTASCVCNAIFIINLSQLKKFWHNYTIPDQCTAPFIVAFKT